MPWTGIERARPGLKVRIGSQQPPRRCALRTGLEPVISRSTGGRPLQLDRQSLAEGGCRRRPSAGPSSHHVVRRAGLEPACPQGTWSTARRASQLPNRRMCRSAGIPGVSAVGRCGDRKPLPWCGSGSCLMLSTIEFALTPHRWGLSRERCPHGHVTVSPVPRCSLASRPGRGSGARGTFHDSHGRRESNPQPPVLETGALPVELRPFAVVGPDG